MSTDSIEREIVINASPERVWAALTEAEQIAGWFGDGAEIDPWPGGAARFSWEGHGSFHIAIERVEPYQHFVFRWTLEAEQQPVAGNSTLVTFTLTPEGPGIRPRVTESGFDSLDLPEDERATNREMNIDGWRGELDELRDYVQQRAT